MGEETHTIMEWDSLPFFTKQQYDIVVSELFFWAAQSIEYKALTAKVFRDDVLVMTINCDTKTDGARIDSLVSLNGTPVRLMNVAC